MTHRARKLFILCGAILATAFSVGCASSEDQRQRDEKTREEVAKATERAKPQIEEAGRELGKAAKEAARQAHAAAQGVRDGWERGSGDHPVDLNSASERELMSLPGIGRQDARKIIEGRPYRNKRELLTRGILSDSDYEKIRADITAKPQ